MRRSGRSSTSAATCSWAALRALRRSSRRGAISPAAPRWRGARRAGAPVGVSRVGASVAISASLLALIHDLGRPLRFLNMLRVFKPSSPMSVGVWILVGYAPLTFGATASEFLDALPDVVGRVAGVVAGVLGAGVSSYTAALIADTAVPAWHGGFRELPF